MHSFMYIVTGLTFSSFVFFTLLGVVWPLFNLYASYVAPFDFFDPRSQQSEADLIKIRLLYRTSVDTRRSCVCILFFDDIVRVLLYIYNLEILSFNELNTVKSAY